MPVGGTRLKSSNHQLRLLLYIFSGIMAFAVLVSWRSQVLFASEYSDLGVSSAHKVTSTNTLQSKTSVLKKQIQEDTK